LPCIMRWPAAIPAGRTCAELVTSMDFLPTFVGLAGGTVSTERILDGHDVAALMRAEPGATSPHEAFYYYAQGSLEAIRCGNWKLHFRKRGEVLSELYNLADDIGEANNLLAGHPEVVERLTTMAEAMRLRLGDRALGIAGCERRPIGQVARSEPLTQYNPAHPYIIAEYDLADAG
jgi:arylsulfatase A